MRYLILCTLSLMLLFSCGADKASTKSAATVKTKEVVQARPAKVNQSTKAQDTKYWNFVKKKLSLTDDQVKDLKKINQKYSGEINKLKKKDKWRGKFKEDMLSQKNRDLRKVLGDSYAKWENTNNRWVEVNK